MKFFLFLTEIYINSLKIHMLDVDVMQGFSHGVMICTFNFINIFL